MQSNTHMLHLLSKMIANRLRLSSAPQLLRALSSYQSELIPVNDFFIRIASNRLKLTSKYNFIREYKAYLQIFLNALSGNPTQRNATFSPFFSSATTSPGLPVTAGGASPQFLMTAHAGPAPQGAHPPPRAGRFRQAGHPPSSRSQPGPAGHGRPVIHQDSFNKILGGVFRASSPPGFLNRESWWIFFGRLSTRIFLSRIIVEGLQSDYPL